MIPALMSFEFPAGWFRGGTAWESYEIGIDKGAGQNNGNAATIKSIEKEIKGYGWLMQSCLPGKYLGKRVRMSGYMKTRDVSDWAEFFFSVYEKVSAYEKDRPNGPLAIDNMHDAGVDRSVKGTTDWKKYEIVLNVPDNASDLEYGAFLQGTGQIWFDNITFEIVDNSVPTTGEQNIHRSIPYEPTNLDFTEIQMMSDPNNVTSFLKVKNRLDIPVSFYWVDYRGKEVFYFNLEPGQELYKETYIGHVWIARDPKDYKKLKEVKVDNAAQTWIIE